MHFQSLELVHQTFLSDEMVSTGVVMGRKKRDSSKSLCDGMYLIKP